MTGSAYQAMDVVSSCESYLQRRVQRGDGSRILTLFEAGGLLQNAIYIYIYIYTQNSIFGGSVLERFLDRFWRGFGIDFGKVFGEVLERFWRGFYR